MACQTDVSMRDCASLAIMLTCHLHVLPEMVSARVGSKHTKTTRAVGHPPSFMPGRFAWRHEGYVDRKFQCSTWTPLDPSPPNQNVSDDLDAVVNYFVDYDLDRNNSCGNC